VRALKVIAQQITRRGHFLALGLSLLLPLSAQSAAGDLGSATTFCGSGRVFLSPLLLTPVDGEMRSVELEFKQLDDTPVKSRVELRIDSIVSIGETPGSTAECPYSEIARFNSTKIYADVDQVSVSIQLRAERCTSEQRDYVINVSCWCDGKAAKSHLKVHVPGIGNLIMMPSEVMFRGRNAKPEPPKS
jgi:hypothetical protein